MAQALNPLSYICRRCRHVISQAQSTTRAFSNTTSRGKTIVEFTPTSSPELDALFNQYRETLFIPSVLSESHRRLIYRSSKHSVLLNEPGVTVTLPSDEDIKLKPMKLSDRPVKRKALPQIQNLLASTQDNEAWNNLMPFLEGMNSAKERIPSRWFSQITRNANEQGKHQLIFRCAEQAKRTNLRLCYPGVVKEMLLGCHNRAAAAGFQGDGLLSAAKYAENVALMLEKEEHCGGKLRPDEVDMRQSLMAVGVLLEMAAAKAVNIHDGNDVDGQVASYVAKVLAMSDVEFSQRVQERLRDEEVPASGKDQSKARLSAKGSWLVKNLPLWHGMSLASKVEGAIRPQTKDTFNNRFKALQQAIEGAESTCRNATEHQPKRGLQMYDRLKSM